MSFKENLKEYFTFTKSESQGIVVLFIILIFAVAANLFLPLIYSHPTTYRFTESAETIDTFDTELFATENSADFFETDKIKNQYDTLSLFYFNPNNLSEAKAELLGLTEYQYNMINKYRSAGGHFQYKSDLQKIYSISKEQFAFLYPYVDLPVKKNYFKKENSKGFKNHKRESTPDVEAYFEFNPNEISNEQWQKLGFSTNQIKIIRNYLNKGGKFFKKEDLKKIYGIEDFQYERIKDYIIIPEKNSYNDNSEKELKITQKVDINTLSADEMKTFGKFWKYNAERIVKYRKLLGGYYKKEQLLEVYGIKRTYYNKVVDDIIIDKSKIEKININFTEVSELGRHPYISYDEAKKIIIFRNNNGSYKELSDLIDKKIISEYIFNKIKPYIKVK